MNANRGDAVDFDVVGRPRHIGDDVVPADVPVDGALGRVRKLQDTVLRPKFAPFVPPALAQQRQVGLDDGKRMLANGVVIRLS